MKSLTFNLRNALSALLCSVVLATAASAQESASSWVKVAPPNEAFTVMMPHAPFPVAERSKSGGLKVAGQRYSLRHGDAEYTIWSFKAANAPPVGNDLETHLDHSAEIAWHLMIEPYWEKLKEESPLELMKYNLTYDGALPSTGHPGRRYRLNLGERQGMTHVYAVGSQIYIVAAAGAARERAGIEEFIKSFTLNLPLPDAPVTTPAGAGVTPGSGGVSENNSGVGSGEAKEIDYNRTFKASETTRKALIRVKPAPSYTEWARRFSVTGAVRVRAVLKMSGDVTEVTAITKLPHGLTHEAVKAARKIKFEPAIKDGRPVTQYVIVEYNFNIY